jgi:hypothetical protein
LGEYPGQRSKSRVEAEFHPELRLFHPGLAAVYHIGEIFRAWGGSEFRTAKTLLETGSSGPAKESQTKTRPAAQPRRSGCEDMWNHGRYSGRLNFLPTARFDGAIVATVPNLVSKKKMSGKGLFFAAITQRNHQNCLGLPATQLWLHGKLQTHLAAAQNRRLVCEQATDANDSPGAFGREMNDHLAPRTDGTNEAALRTIEPYAGPFDYSWIILGLLVLIIIAGGLSEMFGRSAQNRK